MYKSTPQLLNKLKKFKELKKSKVKMSLTLREGYNSKVAEYERTFLSIKTLLSYYWLDYQLAEITCPALKRFTQGLPLIELDQYITSNTYRLPWRDFTFATA